MTDGRANSIADVLISSAERLPAHTAVVDGGRRFTYDELLSFAEGIAEHLPSAGVKKGDRVAIFLPNSAEFAASFFAVALAGGVCVPINPAYRKEEVTFYITHSGSRLALTSQRLKPMIETASDAEILVVSHGGFNSREGKLIRPPATLEDEAAYLYSTGSTGRPKRVCRTHRNLLALAENHSSTLGWTERERVLFAAPMSHTYAFGNFISAVKAGAGVYTLAEFNRAGVLDAIEREAITAYPAVPFMLDILAESFTAAKPRDFSSLRVVLSAGAPLLDSTFQKFHEKFGIYPRQLYGSTETGAIAVNLAEDIQRMGASVGRALRGVEARILREDGRVADVNEVGEITVKSPSMTQTGYFGLPDESAKAFRGGYYHTGDLGRIDEGGYIFITGRMKLFINISGNKVDPMEVENLILTHPKVKDAAVLGITDSDGAETIKAAVVPKERVEAREIYEFLRGRISDFKIPRVIEFRDEIPRSPTGKALRERLK